MTMRTLVLGPATDVPEAWAHPYYLRERKLRIGVARVEGALYAFDDIHQTDVGPCPLTAGKLDGAVIMSQCDGTRFDLRTGAVVGGPGTSPLTVYPAREEDGQIMVDV